MTDVIQYFYPRLGISTKFNFSNNPKGGEVNGLQASMSAVEYTVAHYPTTHVFAHGTSAGSPGAYALGFVPAVGPLSVTIEE